MEGVGLLQRFDGKEKQKTGGGGSKDLEVF